MHLLSTTIFILKSIFSFTVYSPKVVMAIAIYLAPSKKMEEILTLTELEGTVLRIFFLFKVD